MINSAKKANRFSSGRIRNSRNIVLTQILSPLGPMIAGASDNGLCLLEFADWKIIETRLSRLEKLLNAGMLPGKSEYFDDLDTQLNEYFQGKRKDFTIPLEITGTPFQKKAWSFLRGIGYGTTRSYKEQAEKTGNSKAVRAVAGANGKNRIAIIIPCHRVIGSDGQLTGYGGGLWRKKYLLDLEQKNI